VTIVAGTAAFVVWNGVDFVTASVTSTTGVLPVANGGTGLSSGTSGGVLAYTATGTLASSAALAANALVIGGGAGAAPSTTTTGTGVVTALGVNTGTAGAFVVNGGALGTPSSGTVTNLTGTASININGTVGATTATTGAFTTLTTSSTATFSGGTANGVAYLNASKVLTTGAALTFDGTTLGSTGFTSTDGLVANTTNWFNTKIAVGTVTQGYILAGSATPYTTGGSANTRFQVHGNTTYNSRFSITNWGASIGSASTIYLGKSRNSTIGTQTSLNSGDAIGGLYFEGSDGTNFVTTSSITSAVDATPSTGSLSSVLVFGAGVNNAEQMRLTSTGLGIGTSSPTSKLDVTSSTGYANISYKATGGFAVRGDGRVDIGGATGQNAYLGIYKSDASTISNFVHFFRQTGLGFSIGGSSTTVDFSAIGSSGTINFGNTGILTTQLSLDTATGNLGIGTTSPSTRLQTNATINTTYSASNTLAGGVIAYIKNASSTNSTDATIRLEATGSASVAVSSISAVHTGDGASALTFGTRTNAASDVTEKLRLDSSGNLLVGTTATYGGPGRINVGFNQSTNFGITLRNTNAAATGVFVSFENSGGTGNGSISQASSSAVLYNTTSDYRLKNITGPITTSGSYIDSLKPVEGTWKADGSTFVGLIAHETQEASRTIVATGTKDGEQIQGMDYSSAEIIANLIAELQSLRARVAQLESKL